MKKEIDRKDSNILNNVYEIETMINEHGIFEELKKVFRDEIEEVEQTLSIYISENDLTNWKTEVADEWEYPNKKLVYPKEKFNGIHDYQKPVFNLQKKTTSVN